MKYLAIVFLIIPLSLFAQENTITRNIVDANDYDPLEFTAVSLFKLPDTTLVTGVTANMKDIFELKAAPGKYLLRFDFMGYETLFRNITLENNDLKLGTIRLKEDGQFLEEITITAARQLFKSDIDKRTYDVSNNVLTEGATASELLNTLPLVQMDEQGGITLRGSGNVLIYINGRPTNMSSEEMESVLAQFPADSIRTVELITNPSRFGQV